MITIYHIVDARGIGYVGQTRNLKRRIAEHHIGNRRLVRIVAKTRSQKKANELEKRWIVELRTLWPYGHNKTVGGTDGGAPAYMRQMWMSDDWFCQHQTAVTCPQLSLFFENGTAK